MQQKNIDSIFICFAAEDRYAVVEPIVYHLKNYGFPIWYDRTELLMGDNRVTKNLVEGAGHAKYVIAVISKNSASSDCFMEELEIIRKRYCKCEVTIFPVIYEISPQKIPDNLQWIRELIFKEITRSSGTREICNHIACKITNDLLADYEHKNINSVAINCNIPIPIKKLMETYLSIDNENLNARISILYATNLAIQSIYIDDSVSNNYINLVSKIFMRLFDETRLSLRVDYRELWLLENAICLLINIYLESLTDSSI
jgi:hypothetical protein